MALLIISAVASALMSVALVVTTANRGAKIWLRILIALVSAINLFAAFETATDYQGWVSKIPETVLSISLMVVFAVLLIGSIPQQDDSKCSYRMFF